MDLTTRLKAEIPKNKSLQDIQKSLINQFGFTDLDSNVRYNYLPADTDTLHGSKVEDLEVRSVATVEDSIGNPTKKAIISSPVLRNAILMSQSNSVDTTWLGYRKQNDSIELTGINTQQSLENTAIFGRAGFGKTELARNQILQQSLSGYGLCFVSHRDYECQSLVSSLPPDRLDDVIWIEPNSDRDHEVTIDFFETGTNEQSRLTAASESIVPLISANSTPTVQTIIQSLSMRMAKSDEPYTITDFPRILELATGDVNNLHTEYPNFPNKTLQQKFDVSDEERNSIINTAKQLFTNTVIQDTFGDNSGLNLYDAVREDKIIIVNLENINEATFKTYLASIVLQNIIAGIKAKVASQSNPEPFFITIDELDRYDFSDINLIKSVIEQSVQYGEPVTDYYGVTVLTQLPRNHREPTLKSIKKCGNLLTLGTGPFNESIDKLEQFDQTDQFSTEPYAVKGIIQNNQHTEQVKFRIFPPYPQRRSYESTEEIIVESVARYGR